MLMIVPMMLRLMIQLLSIYGISPCVDAGIVFHYLQRSEDFPETETNKVD